METLTMNRSITKNQKETGLLRRFRLVCGRLRQINLDIQKAISERWAIIGAALHPERENINYPVLTVSIQTFYLGNREYFQIYYSFHVCSGMIAENCYTVWVFNNVFSFFSMKYAAFLWEEEWIKVPNYSIHSPQVNKGSQAVQKLINKKKKHNSNSIQSLLPY